MEIEQSYRTIGELYMKLSSKNKEFQYMLAPIEDTSDSTLRTLCHRYGADVTFTEMARFDSLARKNASTWRKIEIVDSTPAYVQIVGQDEQKLKRFLSMYQPPEAFLGFNFNLGCPSPALTNHGLGCAMIKRIAKTKKLVQIVKSHGYSCSIKMRLGLNKFEKEKKVYLHLLNAVDADFFVIHSRIASDTYEQPADFSVYPQCVASGRRIIANGDITTPEHVAQLRKMGVQGIMIGRPAVRDPTIFNKLKDLPVPDVEQVIKEYLALAEQFNSRFKYRKNVLKRLGKPVGSIYEHVYG